MSWQNNVFKQLDETLESLSKLITDLGMKDLEEQARTLERMTAALQTQGELRVHEVPKELLEESKDE